MKIYITSSTWSDIKKIVDWGELYYKQYQDEIDDGIESGITDMLSHIKSIKDSVEKAYEMQYVEIRKHDVYYFERLLDEVEKEKAANDEVVRIIREKMK